MVSKTEKVQTAGFGRLWTVMSTLKKPITIKERNEEEKELYDIARTTKNYLVLYGIPECTHNPETLDLVLGRSTEFTDPTERDLIAKAVAASTYTSSDTLDKLARGGYSDFVKLAVAGNYSTSTSALEFLIYENPELKMRRTALTTLEHVTNEDRERRERFEDLLRTYDETGE